MLVPSVKYYSFYCLLANSDAYISFVLLSNSVVSKNIYKLIIKNTAKKKFNRRHGCFRDIINEFNFSLICYTHAAITL